MLTWYFIFNKLNNVPKYSQIRESIEIKLKQLLIEISIGNL